MVFLLTQVGIYLFFRFQPKTQIKIKSLTLFHKELLNTYHLPYKPLGFFTFGIMPYGFYTKKQKINLFLVNKYSLPELFYLISREVRRQSHMEEKGNVFGFSFLNKQKSREFWFTTLLIWGSIISIYSQSLDLTPEALENLSSLVMLPSNLIIFSGLYIKLFSKKHKKEKHLFHKDLDSWADEIVGGGSSYWGAKINHRPWGQPSFKDRYEQSKNYPFKEKWSDFLR